MSFHHKSALAHILALILMGAAWFSYMPWAIVHSAALLEIATTGAGILFFGNGLLYVYLRRLRCPNCLIRFGPKMYRPGLMHLPWPRRDCWHCGVNLLQAHGEAQTVPPLEKPAPPDQEFPLRGRALLALVVVWNALGLASLFLTGALSSSPTPAMAVSFVFLLAVSWGTKHLTHVQHFLLSDGHGVEEVRRLLTFIQAFAVFGLLALLLFEIARLVMG